MLSIIRKINHIRKRVIISPFNSKLNIGNNFKCGKNCTVSRKNTITIGNNFFMGNYCHLASNLNIADNVLLASFVSFVGGDHKIDNIDTTINKSGRDTFKTTKVCEGVWIGHGSIIMHGVTLNKGCVIASGSIVTKDVPENAIVGGNPAKVIRYRKLKV